MKTLKNFEFPEHSNRGTYDWAKLLDGKIYQLEAGKDFQCKASTFVMMAKNRAKKVGKGVKVATVEGGVVIQAFPLPADKKAADEKPQA